MKTIAIIPARMGSTRFPGKPLAGLCGIPMIGHVYFRTTLYKNLAGVYIATCDNEIRDYAHSVGAKVVMTSASHERCTDRTAEAMLEIEKELGKVDIVVMVQGDEPFVCAEMIQKSVQPFSENPNIQITNLMAPIQNREDFEDPNEVKVVMDRNYNALYFSREPIPSRRKGTPAVPMYKQVCIISFRRDFLIHFNELLPTPLEKIESVDMLRVLEHGYRVKMIPFEGQTISVDTQEDLKEAELLMQEDSLLSEYTMNRIHFSGDN